MGGPGSGPRVRKTVILRGFGTATYDEPKSDTIVLAYLRAFEDFIRKNGRVPNMNVATFQGGFSPVGVSFEVTEEVLDER